MKGADLGLYLYRCRVKIIDNDAFPSNKYRDEIMAGRSMDLPPWSLMKEYLEPSQPTPL